MGTHCFRRLQKSFIYVKVKIMLLDFETTAMLALVTLMTILSIITLMHSNLH